MNLLIFGASGGTGRLLVRQALAQNHAVTAFVRTPAKLAITHAQLTVIVGDVADRPAVARAMHGQDAVLSALGAVTPLRRDPILVTGIRHIVEAMAQAGVQRLIYQSFLGVGDSQREAGFFIRYIAPLLLPHPTADHELKERVITESGLAWTIVRPPKLTNGRLTGRYRIGEYIRARSPVPLLSRADVADAMLRQLDDPTHVRKVVRVMH
jgi:putative NADH-flavin reductase